MRIVPVVVLPPSLAILLWCLPFFAGVAAIILFAGLCTVPGLIIGSITAGGRTGKDKETFVNNCGWYGALPTLLALMLIAWVLQERPEPKRVPAPSLAVSAPAPAPTAALYGTGKRNLTDAERRVRASEIGDAMRAHASECGMAWNDAIRWWNGMNNAERRDVLAKQRRYTR